MNFKDFCIVGLFVTLCGAAGGVGLMVLSGLEANTSLPKVNNPLTRNFSENTGSMPIQTGLTVFFEDDPAIVAAQCKALGATENLSACSARVVEGQWVIVAPKPSGWEDTTNVCILGHEVLHALGYDHRVSGGCD